MVNDLARMQKNRLGFVPPTTLSDQPPPGSMELNLANKLQDQIRHNIVHYAKPEDVISAPVIHTAMGLSEEVDLDLFNEFFTPATTTSA